MEVNRQYIETLLICGEIDTNDLLVKDKMEVIYRSALDIRDILKEMMNDNNLRYMVDMLEIVYNIIRIIGCREECEKYLNEFRVILGNIKKHCYWGSWYNTVVQVAIESSRCKNKENLIKVIKKAKILRCTSEDEIKIRDKVYNTVISMFGPSGMYFQLKDENDVLGKTMYSIIIYKKDSVEFIEEESVHTRMKKMQLIKEYLNDSTELIVIGYNEDESYMLNKIVKI